MTVGSNTLYFTSDTVTLNGTKYYYVKNLQGDVMAILDATGTAVVTYTYNAWGSILGMTDTSGVNLGTLNPLRYRSYVYDSESGLYYLQSRYYDPEVGRFLNADALVATGRGFVGNNMFAYCLNNPVNCVDSDGHDAIWIHESNSANGFGHSGLLVEDEKTGKWYYFYWGPVDEEEDPLVLASSGSPCNCVLIEVEVGEGDLRTVEGVREVLGNSNDFTKSRADKVTDIHYFEGDYSATLTYLENLAGMKELTYHLLVSNCVQNTWDALGKSESRFIIENCPVVPDLAYAKMLAFNFQFVKCAEFLTKEVLTTYVAVAY